MRNTNNIQTKKAYLPKQTNTNWNKILNSQKQLPYFKNLFKKINDEYKTHVVYPPKKDIFNAFRLCAFDDIKVVILAQDPYHNKNQANGLCFSVSNSTPPPSLKNIFKSIKNDLGICSKYLDGDLSPLAKQGVLLLNTILTVREHKPLSHKNYGYEILSDYLITQINDKLDNVVFLFWGNEAKSKTKLINTNKHFVFTSTHPSPFSAYRGFLECKHFSKTNEALESIGIKPIIW